MATTELQTRIALKYDSYTNWTTAPGKDLVLLAGEVGICEISAVDQNSNVVPTVLFKVGDGTKTFEELPWASAKAADVYSWAKSATVALNGTTLEFKTGDVVNHSIDLTSLTTDEETASKIAALAGGLQQMATQAEQHITRIYDTFGYEIRNNQPYPAFTPEHSVYDAFAEAVEELNYSIYDLIVGDPNNNDGTPSLSDAFNAALKKQESKFDNAIIELEAADASLDARLDEVERFWSTLYPDDTLDTTLDTLQEIQNYLKGSGSATGGLLSQVSTNTTDITTIKGIVEDGGTLEVRVDAAESKVTANETNISTLQAIVKGYTSEGSIKTAVDAAKTQADTGVANAKTAQDTADAVKTLVEDENAGLAKTYSIANTANTTANANAGRLEAIEADYLKSTDTFIFQCGTATTVTHVSATTQA